ncbi:MAG TPA: helix-turn-helix domain-containing protein [Anaerolineales bacterium]
MLDRVLGTSFDGYERTVDAHVKNLRAKIETEPGHPAYIETVYGVGYRFAEEGR